MPILSIIIPVFNTWKVLNDCLFPLLRCSISAPLQLVIVDDGSILNADEGESYNLILSLKNIPNLELLIERIPHSGVSAARNRGIECASGQFLWFVDSDDAFDVSHLNLLLDSLRVVSSSIPLFHLGGFHLRKKANQPISSHPMPTATQISNLFPLLQPHSFCLDLSTWIIRRAILNQSTPIRFDFSMSLLEDARFLLLLFDSVGNVPVCFNDTYRFYIRQSFRSSTTSGTWSNAKCEVWLPDILRFFDSLYSFANKNASFASLQQLFVRYRYVYLRVLTVKGCPWILLNSFRNSLLPPRNPISDSDNGLDRLLRFSPLHRFLAFSFRILRR